MGIKGEGENYSGLDRKMRKIAENYCFLRLASVKLLLDCLRWPADCSLQIVRHTKFTPLLEWHPSPPCCCITFLKLIFSHPNPHSCPLIHNLSAMKTCITMKKLTRGKHICWLTQHKFSQVTFNTISANSITMTSFTHLTKLQNRVT